MINLIPDFNDSSWRTFETPNGKTAEYSISEDGKRGSITTKKTFGVGKLVCRVSAEGDLLGVTETHGIVRDGDGAAVEKDGVRTPIDANAIVSMNMWALTPSLLDVLAEGFPKFLASLPEGDVKSEYILPGVIDGMIKDGRATVKVLPTTDRWFGVTYREDKDAVVAAFADLYAKGVYQKELYAK